MNPFDRRTSQNWKNVPEGLNMVSIEESMMKSKEQHDEILRERKNSENCMMKSSLPTLPFAEKNGKPIEV